MLGPAGARPAAASSLVPSHDAFGAALASAGRASRAEGLDGARRELAPYLAPEASGTDAARARTLLGLVAFVHEEPALARELLAQPGLETVDDWRLFALAEAAAASPAGAAGAASAASLAAARGALERLLALHPSSPLRPSAFERAVELAANAGDLASARAWIEKARGEMLPASTVVVLETRAWQLGREKGDARLMSSAARRLLVEAPLEASKLRVVDVLAERRELTTDWRLWLSPDELLRRSQALLEVELPSGALTTLAAVPESARGFEWRLTHARALTAAERGAEGYASLARVTAADSALAARLEWERASAATAAASRSADPAHYRRLAREHLLAVARGSAGSNDLARGAAALRLLALGYLEEGRLTEAVAALRQLAQVDPLDTGAARPLWEKGWQSYERGDRTRAVTIWHELGALYPRTASARSGRYWSARALDASGDTAAARSLYLELAASGTADFYTRQAALRLAGAAATQPAAPVERGEWPEDARLERAAALSELGLDPLALRELALVAEGADPKASAALEAVVLAGTGERRASLAALRRAFPELGTAHQESAPERAVAMFYPTDFRASIEKAAALERLPVSLVYGIVHQESAFDPAATSRSGARGLMQLMPATGKELAHKIGLPYATARLSDPDYSLRLGTRYFRQLLGQFDGNVELALAGYNGGPGRISRLWRAAGPAPELDRFLEGLSVTESRNYVKRILILAESYRSLYPDLG